MVGFLGDAADSNDGVVLGVRVVLLGSIGCRFPFPCALAFWQQVPAALYHTYQTPTGHRSLVVDDLDLGASRTWQKSEAGLGVAIGQAAVIFKPEQNHERVGEVC